MSENQTRGILWKIFIAPGELCAWWGYHFAKPGNILTSERRYHSTSYKVMMAVITWAAAIFLLFSVIAHENNNQSIPLVNQQVMETSQPTSVQQPMQSNSRATEPQNNHVQKSVKPASTSTRNQIF